MKTIVKQAPPAEFQTWVDSLGEDVLSLSGEEQWDVLHKYSKVKRALQEHLLKEQGFICAYCNGRVHRSNPQDDEQLRMDHILPKRNDRDSTLDASNIVGCCFGGDKTRRKAERSCDTRRKRHPLPDELNPTLDIHERTLIFDEEGGVSCTDKKLDKYVNENLGLNHAILVQKRKGLIEDVANLPPDEVLSELKDWQTKNNEMYKSYAGVVITYLKQNYQL